MVETEPEGTLTWAHDWRPDARTYLQRLAGHLEKRAASDQTTSISVPLGKVRLLVTPEEVDLISALFNEGEPGDKLHQLILDGVGLKVKLLATVKAIVKAEAAVQSALDAKNLQSEGGDVASEAVEDDRAPDADGPDGQIAATEASDEDAIEALADVVVDVRRTLKSDIANVDELAAEFHSLVSSCSKAGDLVGAKTVAEHRRRLLAVVEDADRAHPGITSSGDRIGGRDLVTTQAYDPKAAARARQKHLAKTKKKDRKAIKAPKHTVAIAIAGVLLGSLLGVGTIFMRYHQPDLTRFTPRDVKDLPGVMSVIHRSPGILIVVTDKAWDQLKPADRTKAMESLVDLVEPAGYRRAEIRTPTRQNLGLWHRGGHVEIR